MEIQTDCRIAHWEVNILIPQWWIVHITISWYSVCIVTVHFYRAVGIITGKILQINTATRCDEIVAWRVYAACQNWHISCHIHTSCVSRDTSTNLNCAKCIRIEVSGSIWTTCVTRMCWCSICRCIFPIHISTVILRVVTNVYSIIIRVIWWNGCRRNHQLFWRLNILELYW